MKRHLGFSLIEMIVAIIIMGIALVGFTSYLYPQMRESAAPHYQTRAVALGQSLMSQILSRGFDQWSDFDGGSIRCGELRVPANASNPDNNCTDAGFLGLDAGELVSSPESYNDVDDFIGCWKTGTTAAQCSNNVEHDLTDVLNNSSADEYKNFRAEVSVSYATSSDISDTTRPQDFKIITINIFASQYGPYTLTAYKGNY